MLPAPQKQLPATEAFMENIGYMLTLTLSSGFSTRLSLSILHGKKPSTPLSKRHLTPTDWPGHSPASKWFHTYTPNNTSSQ